MKWRTEISIPSSPHKIDHQNSKVLLLGSCFSDNIGRRMSVDHFKVISNPFGTLYHPLSIYQCLQLALQGSIDDGLFVRTEDDIYKHYAYHGKIHAPTRSELTHTIAKINEEVRNDLSSCSHLFLTFGSVQGYYFQGRLVANCHKTPGHQFDERFTNSSEIWEKYSHFFKDLKRYNPNIQIFLTVSPVRHIRMGMVENQRSKSRLIEIAHQLVDAYDYCHYLPVYELIMDDLRDYRYYDSDLVHPSETAVDYVYRKFEDAFFGTHTKNLCMEIRKLHRAAHHRPLHPESVAHSDFCKKTLEKIVAFEQAHGIDLHTIRETIFLKND